MPKEVKYIERNGEKYIHKKSSWIKKVKMIFLAFTIAWFAVAIMIPLKVKRDHSDDIKRSIVVSMFFDLQQGIAEQYARLLNGIKGAINLEKPINAAIAKVKMAEAGVGNVQNVAQNTQNQATQTAQNVNKAQNNAQNTANKVTGALGRVGIGTNNANKAVQNVTGGAANIATAGVNAATSATAAAINVTQQVNDRLNKVESELVRIAQFEVDQAIDNVVRDQLDRVTGGLSNVLLAQYKTQNIRPWKPSTWKLSNRIYAEIAQSSKSTVDIIMRTIDKYFGYVAWALVIIAWLLAFFIWKSVHSKYKLMIEPFMVCPNCGHAFTNKKRVAGLLLKIVQPWKWLS